MAAAAFAPSSAKDRFDHDWEREGRTAALPGADAEGRGPVVVLPLVSLAATTTSATASIRHPMAGTVPLAPPISTKPGSRKVTAHSPLSSVFVRANYDTGSNANWNKLEVVTLDAEGDRKVTEVEIVPGDSGTSVTLQWHYVHRWSKGFDVYCARSSGASPPSHDLRVVNLDPAGNVTGRVQVRDETSFLTLSSMIQDSVVTYREVPVVSPFEQPSDEVDHRGLVLQLGAPSAPRSCIVGLTNRELTDLTTELVSGGEAFFNNGISIDSTDLSTQDDSHTSAVSAGNGMVVIAQHISTKQENATDSKDIRVALFRTNTFGGPQVICHVDLAVPSELIAIDTSVVLGAGSSDDGSWWATLRVAASTALSSDTEFVVHVRREADGTSSTTFEVPGKVSSSSHASDRIGFAVAAGDSTRVYTVQADGSPVQLVVRSVTPEVSAPFGCFGTRGTKLCTAMATSDLGVIAFAAAERKGLATHPVVVLYDLVRDAEVLRLHCGVGVDENAEELALTPGQKALLRACDSSDQFAGLTFVQAGDHVRLIASVVELPRVAGFVKPGDLSGQTVQELDLLELRGRGSLVIV